MGHSTSPQNYVLLHRTCLGLRRINPAFNIIFFYASILSFELKYREGEALRSSTQVSEANVAFERSRADGGMVDAHALGACGETHGGSSPLPPTRICPRQILIPSLSRFLISETRDLAI